MSPQTQRRGRAVSQPPAHTGGDGPARFPGDFPLPGQRRRFCPAVWVEKLRWILPNCPKG